MNRSHATEDWKRTDRELPAEGEVVLTMDSAGKVQELKRSGRLWFIPDGSMYVYYTPTMWKPKPAAPTRRWW